MLWEWRDTRWILQLPDGRQLDIEVCGHWKQLWYRAPGKTSLLIGNYRTIDTAKEEGLATANQLVRNRKILEEV
jgi:hypothetical protein